MTIKLQPKPKSKTTDGLKVALQTVWEELSQEHTNKAATSFTKRLTAYKDLAVTGGHFDLSTSKSAYPSPTINRLFSQPSTDSTNKHNAQKAENWAVVLLETI